VSGDVERLEVLLQRLEGAQARLAATEADPDPEAMTELLGELHAITLEVADEVERQRQAVRDERDDERD